MKQTGIFVLAPLINILTLAFFTSISDKNLNANLALTDIDDEEESEGEGYGSRKLEEKIKKDSILFYYYGIPN